MTDPSQDACSPGVASTTLAKRVDAGDVFVVVVVVLFLFLFGSLYHASKLEKHFVFHYYFLLLLA